MGGVRDHSLEVLEVRFVRGVCAENGAHVGCGVGVKGDGRMKT